VECCGLTIIGRCVSPFRRVIATGTTDGRANVAASSSTESAMDEMTRVSAHVPDEAAMPPLGAGPAIHPSASVRDCVFGAYTAVGARTRMLEVEMGAYSYVVTDAEIACTSIGKFVSIAAHTRVNPGNHPMWRASQHHFSYRAQAYGLGPDDADFFDWRRDHPVEIGHDVWIGHGAVILPGRRVGIGAIVGAGAIVTKDVPPYMVVVGNPARPVRRRFADNICADLEALAWWNWPHEKLATALPDMRAMDAADFAAKYRDSADRAHI
jgi:phosphonate metabolism protein (transferase hexapeptide repeat family)